ncbi:hypothetical protein GCM10028796_30650 [Ramlibacter monticola]
MIVLGILTILVCTAYRFRTALTPTIAWDSDVRKVVMLRLDAIMIGVLSAFLLASGNRIIRSRVVAATLSLLFLFSIVYSANTPTADLNSSLFAKTILFNVSSLGCLGFILLGYSLEIGKVSMQIPRFFAKISYSAYLCNLSLVVVLDRFIDLAPIIKWTLFFPTVIGVSYVAHRFWESKFMAYRDRRFRDTPFSSGPVHRSRSAPTRADDLRSAE